MPDEKSVMGSAFPSDGLGNIETVLFLQWDGVDDSMVVHMRHEECLIECPHLMSECGRFPKRQYPLGASPVTTDKA